MKNFKTDLLCLIRFWPKGNTTLIKHIHFFQRLAPSACIYKNDISYSADVAADFHIRNKRKGGKQILKIRYGYTSVSVSPNPSLIGCCLTNRAVSLIRTHLGRTDLITAAPPLFGITRRRCARRSRTYHWPSFNSAPFGQQVSVTRLITGSSSSWWLYVS